MCQSNYFQNVLKYNQQESSDVCTEFGESTVCYSKVMKKFHNKTV